MSKNYGANKAIYRAIPSTRVSEQDTLIYDRKDGFAWVRFSSPADGNIGSEWADFFPTAVAAETSAREAGLDPRAVYYIG